MPARQDPSSADGRGLPDALGDAARGSALGRGLAEEELRGAVLAGIGGWRGLLEALLPGVAFLAVYAATAEIWWAIAAAAGIGVLLLGLRLLQRGSVTQAVGGLIGMGLSALLVRFTGQDEQYFAIGFWTTGALALALLISLLLRRPLIGVLVGALMGDGGWRGERRKRIALTWLTIAWLGVFVLRIAVQLPAYFAGDVAALASLRLALGLPLTAPVFVLSWLVARGLYPEQPVGPAVQQGDPAAPADGAKGPSGSG